MRNLPLPCQCEGGVEITHANDVQGVTEYYCPECNTSYPLLKPGESWEPWENETTTAYADRCMSYHARLNPINELPQEPDGEPWQTGGTDLDAPEPSTTVLPFQGMPAAGSLAQSILLAQLILRGKR